MSEREEWISLIRNEYDPKPDLGRAAYPAFDAEWDDGAGRIADAILADKTILLRRQALEVADFLKSHQQQVFELFAEIERLRRCCARCMGSGYSSHPGSAEVCEVCGGAEARKCDGEDAAWSDWFGRAQPFDGVEEAFRAGFRAASATVSRC